MHFSKVSFHCGKPQQDVHFKMSVVLLPSSVSECKEPTEPTEKCLLTTDDRFYSQRRQKILELSGKTITGNPVNISSLYIGGKLEAERKGRLNLPKLKAAYQGLIIHSFTCSLCSLSHIILEKINYIFVPCILSFSLRSVRAEHSFFLTPEPEYLIQTLSLNSFISLRREERLGSYHSQFSSKNLTDFGAGKVLNRYSMKQSAS